MLPSGVSPRASRRRKFRDRAGFTIIEVTMATGVMLFGIASSILVIQSGFRAIDNARNTTLAAQILQSEMERIRLLPWDTDSLDASGNRKPSISRLPAEPTELDLKQIFPAGATTDRLDNYFTTMRTCATVANTDGEIKQITITVTWTGLDGTSHTRSSSTHYAKNGLYDYYYTKATSG